ncbi:hypothetical protein UC8_13880 [Roseimaritima ulvae]|uniref:Uncharacterized protein n=1 Tax=Roseimaritima ulvae TaxID=980254 RepID=A0A5B9QMT9_9BACT|nr:hypothetical protein UC8_13880 [Roseimaritima ulvae]
MANFFQADEIISLLGASSFALVHKKRDFSRTIRRQQRLLPQNRPTLVHTSHTQRSEQEFFSSMFTKQQSNRLERIHEGIAFGGSDWRLGQTFHPGNSPYRLLT